MQSMEINQLSVNPSQSVGISFQWHSSEQHKITQSLNVSKISIFKIKSIAPTQNAFNETQGKKKKHN